jgi:peptidoglycan-N-acetylglucosamine deacetylase
MNDPLATSGSLRTVRRRATVRRLVGKAARPVLGSITGVTADDPVMALTYDDGPDPLHTPCILEPLARHNLKATFFVLSEKAASSPALVHEMQAAGHEVALHGRWHRDLTQSSVKEVIDLVWGGHRQLEPILGKPIRFFRPPYGHQSVLSYGVARLSGLLVVGWSVSVPDWLPLGVEELVSQVFCRLRPGGILLLHDSYEPASSLAESAPGLDRGQLVDRLVEEASARQWRFVPVGELLRGRRAERSIWINSLK